MDQIGIQRREATITRMLVHFVASETEVSEDQALIRQTALHQCLQPPVMLHAVRKAIADKTYAISGLERDLSYRCQGNSECEKERQ